MDKGTLPRNREKLSEVLRWGDGLLVFFKHSKFMTCLL